RGVVTDFGFSKMDRGMLEPADSAVNLTPLIQTLDPQRDNITVTGSRSGTAKYMSPQRLLGEGTTTKDDVYAFGITILSVSAIGNYGPMPLHHWIKHHRRCGRFKPCTHSSCQR
ncbi:hypothetical protein M427DRAFT_54943, partial [Gonapodya prolifera JEL478]